MLVTALLAIGALLCVVPVAFGFLVTRWVKRWSRADREGPLA